MKKIFVVFLVSFVNVSAQELFIQGEDQYKGSIKDICEGNMKEI